MTEHCFLQTSPFAGFGRRGFLFPDGRSRALAAQIGFALLAMLAFCVSDVLAKLLAPAIPPLEVAWFRYLGGMVLLVPILIRRRLWPRSRRPAVQIVRSVCMLASTWLLISAVQRMPIAEATTLVFVSPIFVTLLSAALLGEAVSRLRLICVFGGLAGVVLVARPDPSGMDAAALLPIASAACWALAMVLTRVTQAHGDSFMTTLAFAASVGFALLCLALPGFFVVPDLGQLAVACAMSLCWVVGQVAVLAAYRIGRIADVAPFAYTQIIWAVVLGYLVFSDLPDLLALSGCAVVIVSGVAAARESRQADLSGPPPGSGGVPT